MDMHKNARLTPRGRERIVGLVASGQTPKAVALAAGVCPRTIRKWVARYRAEGATGLQDRSSRSHRLRRPSRALHPDELARTQMNGPRNCRDGFIATTGIGRTLI